MNCEKCGAEIPEGAVFCVQCGNRITAPDLSETPNGGSGGSKAQSGSVVSEQGVKARVGQSFATGSMTSKKFDITKLIPVAVLAVVLIIALVVFFKVRKTRVNLNDYISVENNGYDGYGSVEVSFDKEEFVKDFKGKIKPNKKIKSMIKDEDKVKAIVDRNDYSVRKEKDICRLFADVFTAAAAVEDEGKMGRLSNGDVIVYKWNFDSDAMPVDDAEEFAKEAFNVKLVSGDYEFTVDGLEKVDTFDPFEGVELSFSGVSPAATAEITAKPEGNGLDYSIENGYKLKKGDNVIVTASYGWNDQESYI
nr:zinc ribbon domain-containing protein [Lachnospiraceae bacterium]